MRASAVITFGRLAGVYGWLPIFLIVSVLETNSLSTGTHLLRGALACMEEQNESDYGRYSSPNQRKQRTQGEGEMVLGPLSCVRKRLKESQQKKNVCHKRSGFSSNLRVFQPLPLCIPCNSYMDCCIPGFIGQGNIFYRRAVGSTHVVLILRFICSNFFF